MSAARTRSRPGTARFRRSPGLVVFWHRGRLAYFDARSGQRRTLPASALPLLDSLSGWSSSGQLSRACPSLGAVAAIESLLKRMERLGLVEREDCVVDWPWADWAPEAAFFHFATRDADYPSDLLAHERALQRKAETIPQPPPTKRMPGPRVALAPASLDGDLVAALRERRTWRSLSDRSLTLSELGDLLGLTFGVQRRGYVQGQGEVVFKTSPSGGARHPTEAYVIANRVEGVAPAVYHYDAAEHALVRVAPPIPKPRLQQLLAKQFFFANCGAAIVMTACFERTMWRYPYPRAYRAVLIEAGHLGQTFCLAAIAWRSPRTSPRTHR